jgi:hypothetical protein
VNGMGSLPQEVDFNNISAPGFTPFAQAFEHIFIASLSESA